MPGTNAEGLPTPLDSDVAGDLALAVRNLADAVTTRIKRGSGTINFAATAQVSLAVVFPTAFVFAVPTVIATSTDPFFVCNVTAVSKTGFTVSGWHPGGNVSFGLGFTWIASDL